MIELTVKKIGVIGTTITSVTPFSSLFQETEMHALKAEGQDTRFFYKDHEYVVDETYATIKALIQLLTTTQGFEKEIWGLFDATGGKNTGTHDIVDPVTLVAIELPIGARVFDGFYIVETTFTSAGADAGTIALGYATDGAAALKAAVAISDGSNPWDAGTAALIPVGTAATLTAKTTAQRKVQAVVAAQNLTAGKLKVCLKYVIVP
jgi:hypothetical protein